MTKNGVTESQLTNLLWQLKASGQARISPDIIPGDQSTAANEGQFEGRGALCKYRLSGTTLTVDIIHGPWGVPLHMVEAHIQQDILHHLAQIREEAKP